MDVVTRFREYARLDRKRSGGGLSPAELERWLQLKRQLGREFSPGLSDARSDERASVRVPARLSVSFHSVGELRSSLMTNLSRGGLFVATDHPAEIGSRLTLRIQVEAPPDEIVVPTEVVSLNVSPDLTGEQRGMGLRFLEMADEVQKKVDALYERQLENKAAERKGAR